MDNFDITGFARRRQQNAPVSVPYLPKQSHHHEHRMHDSFTDAPAFQSFTEAGFGSSVASVAQAVSLRDVHSRCTPAQRAEMQLEDFEQTEQLGDDAYEHKSTSDTISDGQRAEATMFQNMERLVRIRDQYEVKSTVSDTQTGAGHPVFTPAYQFPSVCNVDMLLSELALLPRVRIQEPQPLHSDAASTWNSSFPGNAPSSQDRGAKDNSYNLLRQGLMDLPLSTTLHDSRVLCAAVPLPGSGAPSFPPCSRGIECIGALSSIPGPNFGSPGEILMRYMTPLELSVFLQDPSKATESQCPGLCLLCLRFFSCQFLAKLSALGSACTVVESRVFQLFRSSVGCPGGYKREAMFHLTPDNWTGFICPVVMFQPGRLRWVLREHRWCVDQTQLIIPVPGPILCTESPKHQPRQKKKTV